MDVIKTILVPVSGSSTDDAVFATALAAARPLAAHLDFYHVRLNPAEAAVRAPHTDFVMGAALPEALAGLSEEEAQRSAAAAAHVKSFCDRHRIPLRTAPDATAALSASFLEERSRAHDRLMIHARHDDLVVLGRSSHADYLPPTLMEDLLVGCGRPLLLAPDFAPVSLTGRIVVGWKETPEAARALGAAWPLLEKAKELILLSLLDEAQGTPRFLEHLALQLRWHGIKAETRVVSGQPHALSHQLARAASDLKADLLVVGAFGHSRLRELVFGGVTQSLLEHANVPVFMMN